MISFISAMVAATTKVAEPDGISNGWIAAIAAVGVPLMIVLGKLIDLRFFRDKDNTEFRRDLMRRIGKLEARDEEQQGIIDKQDRTIEQLREEIDQLRQRLNREQKSHHKERKLKHYFAGKANAANLILQMYRDKCGGRIEDDHFDFNPEDEARAMDSPDFGEDE